MAPYPSGPTLPAEAQPIIDRYAGICNADYYLRLRGCIAALREASASVDTAEAYLRTCPIEGIHWSDASDMPWMAGISSDRHDILRELRRHRDYYEGVALALQVSADADKKDKQMRAVPEQVYIDATKELMVTYEETFGSCVVYPDARQAIEGQSIQPSTHFIAQCLVAIDPACDLDMAVTCIKKARDWDTIKGANVRMGEIIAEK